MMHQTVLQILPSLSAGGAERTTIDIAGALAKDGYSPVIISEGGRMEPEAIRAGATLIHLPAASKNPAVIWRNAAEIADIIRTRKISLIHARSRAPAWSALFAARRTRIPFVTTYHGIYNGWSPLKRYYNSVMARGDAVIANSQWTADHILKTYPQARGRLAVIPRGIDLAYFNPAAVKPEAVATLRRRWQIADAERVVFLPGRMTRWKGQHVFLDAVALLKAQGRWPGDARAVIAGDPQGRDSYFSELSEAIAHKGLNGIVSLGAHVADMPAAYLASDIVVSASIEPEAFGRVPAEAGAMGRPVIATDHGGARETLIQGRTGFLIDSGKPELLAGAMVDMLSMSPEQRAAMGAAGRAHVADHFTRERMCADTLAVYRRLIG